MKNHINAVIVGRAIRIRLWCTVILPFLFTTALSGRTVCTSTGGTSGTPLNWSSSGSWSCSGSGAPRVYIIQSTHHIYFDVSNASPYIDTVLIYGHLIMGNNVLMTFTATGAIGLIGTNSTISGGSNNTQFVWDGTLASILGPFTAADIISNGPRYASATSTLAAGGAAQASFIMGTLPIDLTSFYSTCVGSAVNLGWSTSMEMGSDHFDLLMSRDNEYWSVINTQQAAGESYETRDYSYRYTEQNTGPDGQMQPAQGSYYFKLRAVDRNGVSTLSDGIVAKCTEASEIGDSDISVSPNPSVGAPQMNVVVIEPGEMAIDIYSETGKLCKTYNVTGQFSDQVFTFVIQDLDPGIYRARLLSSNTTRSTTFVKL